MITQFCTNETVALKCGPINIRHNIFRIGTYTYGTIVEYITPENICDDVKILSQVIYFFITLKLGHEVYNRICMETLMSIHIGRVREVFHEKVIFFTLAAPYVTR